MLRTATLLACLLLPLAGRAQTASLTVSPSDTFGKADCVAAGDTADPALSLAWTVVPPAGTIPTSAWTYKVKALPSTASCSTENSDTYLLNGSTALAWSSNSGTYPGTSGDLLHLSDLVAKAGLACTSTADLAITLCVQLFNGDSTAAISTTVARKVTVQLAPPPAPVGVSVSAGNQALNVSWAAGTGGTVTTESYQVTASSLTCDPPPSPLTVTCLGPVVSSGTTSARTLRLGGLTNGVTYGVQVYARSTGGNLSDPSSPPVAGTPLPVNDFWQQYVADHGIEQGGCGGGPAGLLSLLAVAGLARALGRRS